MKIPKPILTILANGPWKSTDYECGKFATGVESHAGADRRDGHTCTYHLSADLSRLSEAEFKTIVAAKAIRPELHQGSSVNQHWLHSLEQFFAECQRAWADHVKRTDAIIGTAAGRIHPSTNQPTIRSKPQ